LPGAMLLLSFLLACTGARCQLHKLYLHPKAAGSEKQSQFTDSLRFIPLEVKDGISLGNYSYVQVTEKHFLVTDYSTKNILLYSRAGAFLKKIDYRKVGEGFYPSYQEHTNEIVFFGDNKNYALTSKDRISIMLDWNNPRNRKYFKKYRINLNDTTLVIEKVEPEERDIIRAQHFYDEYYWRGQINTSPLYKDSVDYEAKVYSNNKVVKGFFPYNPVSEARFLFTEENSQFSRTDTPYVHVVTRPYCDTIYKMIKDSLYPAYHLLLPLENSLPAYFFTRPFKNKTERENFARNNGWMMRQVYAFYETPSFIFLSIRYFSNTESYIYVKRTNATYKVRNIKAESSQYNLQLLADYGLTKKGDRFYKSLKAGDLVTFFEQNKQVPVPKELEAFLKSKPSATAPVMVEFKFKN
jgi:hypothetical protein